MYCAIKKRRKKRRKGKKAIPVRKMPPPFSAFLVIAVWCLQHKCPSDNNDDNNQRLMMVLQDLCCVDCDKREKGEAEKGEEGANGLLLKSVTLD